MDKTDWIRCPKCGSKTRTMIREHMVLEDFPLFCPKCRYTCVPQNGIGLQQRGGIGAAGGAAGGAQLIHCRCILRGKQLRVEHIKIGFGHQ